MADTELSQLANEGMNVARIGDEIWLANDEVGGIAGQRVTTFKNSANIEIGNPEMVAGVDGNTLGVTKGGVVASSGDKTAALIQDGICPESGDNALRRGRAGMAWLPGGTVKAQSASLGNVGPVLR